MASLLESAPRELTSAAHQHTLTLLHTGGGGALFKCDGCQQPGTDEARYRCDPCNFELHMPCALPVPQSTIAHPRFGGHRFTFFTGLPSPGAGNSRLCDACGDHVLGFVYHSQGGLDLHPCCASLKETIVYNGREFHLSNVQANGACELCHQDNNGPRGKFWTYTSFHGDGGLVSMHVACLLYHGDRNPNLGPATERRRSICTTSSSTQTAFTASQMMNPIPIPTQMMTAPANVASIQTFCTLYTFGNILKEMAIAAILD